MERMDHLKGWIRRWEVPGTDAIWTVALKVDGSYGCSCPPWRFAKSPKPDCRHIEFIKANPSYGERPNKRIVLANVREVTLHGNEELYTPLIPCGDLHFSLTVACDLARYGAGPEEVNRYLHGNRLQTARAYIAQNGRRIYGAWSESLRRHDGFEIVRDAE